METADVVIVGAGVNGAAVAHYLSKRKVGKILVIDRSYPGAGASSRGMGLLRTYHANDPEAVLAIRSLEVFRNWNEAVGGTCGFVETGFMWLDRAERQEDVRANVDRINRLGGRAELLKEAQIRSLQPHMIAEDTVAAWEPDCGGAYGALATDAFIREALSRGVVVKTRTAALSLRTKGGRITGVDTSDGPVSSDTVVLAAGAWSRPLGATAGVDFPIEARRLTIGRVFLPDDVVSPVTFLDAAVDTSLRSEAGNTALISMRDSGYGRPIDPDRLKDDVDTAAIQSGIDRLARRIPAARRSVAARTWTGVDGFTSDFKGIYGRVDDVAGLIACVGASEKGFKVSPAVGMGLAELIADGRSETIENPAFSARRFTKGSADNNKSAFGVHELI